MWLFMKDKNEHHFHTLTHFHYFPQLMLFEQLQFLSIKLFFFCKLGAAISHPLPGPSYFRALTAVNTVRPRHNRGQGEVDLRALFIPKGQSPLFMLSTTPQVSKLPSETGNLV